ncbi:apoptosis-inducing factor 3 isoform X1 [Nasonia vitripennis]|uniref:Rieske domain-containing protein n=1 Tax=Nasonia vitripennis TaxID=7425 RepID=A0A7M7QYC1_NASVI|nr:apoptosis-inducing factor 3 isoform X1 [Nasonia vitripennis]XP_031788126.1 apoptosis-inducing factor 3 isoform X1 [Nasonia vitripennis]XP_032456613.1 apoptosis-inducing factor 3 isoform X1 [Nasonia vitripennis]
MGGSNCKSFSPKHINTSKVRSSESFSSRSNGDDRPAGNGQCKQAAGKTENTDYIEDVVCKETDIQENEMKTLPLGEEGGKILLIKQKGELHAIGTKCTHYGALLHTGALGEGRVRCPWHGACFNIKNGDIEDYPGLDSLPCYKVSVGDGQIRVRAKRSELLANKRTKGMCKLKQNYPETVVVVGGGPAGATCVETLRQEGFQGRILMVCREDVLPYDRVKVSKTIDFDVQKALLRPQSFYNEHNIETKLGNAAISLNVNRQIVTLSDGEELHYNHLFIATGCKPKRPDFPGVNLKNIYVMRDYTDSQGVNKELGSDKHVVCFGLGFVGMEAAAYCIDKVASVTVIGRSPTPFKSVFGEEIGNRVRKEFESKGIKFISDSGIDKFIPREDHPDVVSKVELKDGRQLPADIVILGIGSTLYTDWMKDSGVTMLDDGSIEVDKYLRTNVPNVYAGGDIAYAPIYSAGISATIGHYPLAHYHGKIAAINICKKVTPLQAVPFFWTTLFGKSYRYAGYGTPERIKVHGSLEDFKFFAYYFKDGKVIAMSSVGRDPIVADFANLLYEGKSLTEEEVEKDPIGWIRSKPKDLQASIKPDTQTQQ